MSMPHVPDSVPPHGDPAATPAPPATPEELAALKKQLDDFLAQIEADRMRFHDQEIARLQAHLANAANDEERAEIKGWIDKTQAEWDAQQKPSEPQA